MSAHIAEAYWNGSLTNGHGQIQIANVNFTGHYTFNSRYNEVSGTNPEELLGAGLAACYSMALAAELDKHNFYPRFVHTVAHVNLTKQNDRYSIDSIELDTEADCNDIDAETFLRHCESAKLKCVVANALASTKIKLTVRLESKNLV